MVVGIGKYENITPVLRIIYGRFAPSEPQHRQSSPINTPKFGWNRGGVALLSRKPAISLKRGKIGPRLHLLTYLLCIILHVRWRMCCWTDTQNQTLEKESGKMLERYGCDDVNGDRSVGPVDRFASDHHGTHYGTAAGRPGTGERHTQIF